MTKKQYPKDKEIHWVCNACGIVANYLTCLKKYKKPPLEDKFVLSTYHNGRCDVCKKTTSITEARDFFYPNFELLQKLINKYANRRSKNNLQKN